MTAGWLLYLFVSASLAAAAQTAEPIDGKPSPKAQPGAQKPIATAEFERIDQARRVVREFAKDLPDFTCEQFTRRFQGRGQPMRWTLFDLVTADLLYVGGEERYTNIKVNNQPPRSGSISSGAWSGGEYGLIQLDVLAQDTDAKFKFRKNTKYDRRSALLFEYSVKQENSQWEIEFEGDKRKPAYEGQVWIDMESNRPLRIEMRAREVPVSYPLRVIETTVDYGIVTVDGRDLLFAGTRRKPRLPPKVDGVCSERNGVP